MAYDKIDELYDALKKDGAVSHDRNNFRAKMLAPGNEGYQNRLQLFNALKKDGAVSSPTYEAFAAKLGMHAVPTAKPKQQQKPQAAASKPQQQAAKPQPKPQPWTAEQRKQAEAQLAQNAEDNARLSRQWQQQSDNLKRQVKRSRRLGPDFAGEAQARAVARTAGIEEPTTSLMGTPSAAATPVGVVKGDDGKWHNQYELEDGSLTTDFGDVMRANEQHDLRAKMRRRGIDPDNADEGDVMQVYLDKAFDAAVRDDSRSVQEAASEASAGHGSWVDNFRNAVRDEDPQYGDAEFIREIKRAQRINPDAIVKNALELMPPSVLRGLRRQYGLYFEQHPKELKGGQNVQQAAEEAIKAPLYQQVYNKLVAAHAPKSTLEYLLRKITDQPLFSQHIANQTAAGAITGNHAQYLADEQAMSQYGNDHPVASFAGMVGNMAADPFMYAGGYVGSLASKAVARGIGRAVVKNASKKMAERLASRTLAGRIAQGVAAGAGNMGVFEAGHEAVRQDRTGEHSVGGLLAAAGRGVLLGAATGVAAPLIGNVADKLVARTASTGGKLAVRAGETTTSVLAEGTIFAAPELYENAQLADDDPNKRSGWSIWAGNLGTMAGIKGKHLIESAPRVIAELRTDGARRGVGFEGRLRDMLDRAPADLQMTKADLQELRDRGYGGLAQLYARWPTPPAHIRRGLTESEKKAGIQRPETEELGKTKDKDLDGYATMQRLMDDHSVSAAVRAKAYYLLTGKVLPMPTVLSYDYTNNEDGTITITAMGAENPVPAYGSCPKSKMKEEGADVVLRKTFKSRKEAMVYESKLRRQIELNTVDVGEQLREAQVQDDALDAAIDAVYPNGNHELLKNRYWSGDKAIREALDKHMQENPLLDENSPRSIQYNIEHAYGVDIDKALKKEPNRRDAEEAAAVQAYVDKLYDFGGREEGEAKEVDGSGPAGVPPAAAPEDTTEQAREEGRKAWAENDNGEDDGPLQGAVDEKSARVHEALDRLYELFDEEAVSVIKYDPNAMLNSPMLSEEHKAAIREYAEAMAGLDGVKEAAQEAAEQNQAEVENEVVKSTNKETKLLMPATMKDDSGNPVSIYVVDGKLVLNTLGGIDTQKSAQTIVVYDPSAGKHRFVDTKDIIEIWQPVSPADAVQAATEAIQQRHKSIFDNAELKQLPAPKTESGEGEKPVEAEQPKQEPETTPAAEGEPKQPIPMGSGALGDIPRSEKGEPVYEQAEPATAWQAILEQAEGDNDMAASVVDGMVADKEAAVKKAEKAKPKHADTVSGKIAAEKERKAAIERAKAELEAWKKIAAAKDEHANAAKAQKAEEAKKQDEERHAAAVAKAEKDKAEQQRKEGEQAENADERGEESGSRKPAAGGVNEPDGPGGGNSAVAVKEKPKTKPKDDDDDGPDGPAGPTGGAAAGGKGEPKGSAGGGDHPTTPPEDNGQPKDDATQKPASTRKIEDVGEHIAGARKDELAKMAQSLGDVTLESLIELPASKAFKRPDLKKAVKNGVLREEDARFAEAVMAAFLGSAKPKLKDGFRRAKSEAAVRAWAEHAKEGVDMLAKLFSLDAEGRDKFMAEVRARKMYREEEVRARQRQMEQWNPGKVFNGTCYPLNPVDVMARVMERLGYEAGAKVPLPVVAAAPDSTFDLYILQTRNGKTYYPSRQLTTIDDVVDEMVYAAKVENADPDTDHPAGKFSVKGVGAALMEPTGKWEVKTMTSLTSMVSTHTFDTKEEAEKFSKEYNASGKNHLASEPREQTRTTGYSQYEIVYRHDSPTKGTYTHMPTGKVYGSLEEARAAIDGEHDELNGIVNAKLAEEKGKSGEKKDPFKIVMYTKDGKTWKYGVVLADKYAPKKTAHDTMPFYLGDGFATHKEAQAFLEEHREEWNAKISDIDKARRSFTYFNGTGERKGTDWRKGKDVSAEQLMEQFGFRGVQFGNWTNQRDRQAAVNNAFDALMDLAQILGVSPRAISLNGELGLAFGSRGSGGAAAHYEPSEVVINLTKTQGAGSLAHEWWHALDNYFARHGNVKLGMVTESKGISMRDALRKAYNDLIDSVAASDYNSRSRDRGASYWGRPAEETARLFAAWVNDELQKRGMSSPFLSDTDPSVAERYAEVMYSLYKAMAKDKAMTLEEFKKTPLALRGFVYPSTEELESFGEHLRNIFNTVQEKVDKQTGKTLLYHRGPVVEEPDEAEQALLGVVNDALKDTGIEVSTDVDAGQKVLDAGDKEDVRLMGSHVKKRMNEIGAALENSEMTDEQRKVTDVFSGKTNNMRISVKRGNGSVTLQMRQGAENKAGTKHSIFRHYGTGTGYITAEDVMKVTQVMSEGVATPKQRGKTHLVEYKLTKDGVTYTLVTEKRKGGEIFNDFYTNRKAPQPGTSNTLESAHTDSSDASDAAKVGKNSETANDGGKEKPRFFRTPDGEAYGFTVGGKIYVDPRIARADTPIHEYTHLWGDMMRRVNPKAWGDIVRLMKGKGDLWEWVKKNYPELKTDDEIADEVLAQFSGKRGAERLREEMRKVAEGDGSITKKAAAISALARVKEALGKFWRGVAELLHIRFTTAEEVADRVLNDLLHNVDPRKVGGETGVAKEKDGIRFSLRDKDKTLAGVHNISEDKLRKALKLGGLANPSLAVVDTDKNDHSSFGEISLIAPSSLVDKRSGRTAGTWSTDAYTQRYPQVERQMSGKGHEKFKTWVSGLDFTDEEKREIERQTKDALESGKEPDWGLMYLHDKGVDVKGYSSQVGRDWEKIIEGHPTAEDIIKAMGQDPDLNDKVSKLAWNETVFPIRNRISLEVREQIMKETGERLSPISPRVKKAAGEIFDRDYAPALLDMDGKLKAEDVKKVVSQMVEKYDATKRYDFQSSKSKANAYIQDNGLHADYLKWMDAKLGEFGVKGNIFRGFKDDGTRKYVPETLDNVSRVMREEAQGMANGGEYTSFGSFIAKFAPRVDSKEEMRDNKGRLATEEAKQAFYDKWEDTYYGLAEELGRGDAYSGEMRLHDIAMQPNPKEYAKKEYGITLSGSFVDKLNALKKAIREDLKSPYFETKFERPVKLGEFSSAVVPKSIDADVRKRLEDAGLTLYDYDPQKEGDRKRAFDEATQDDGVRFRLLDDDDPKAQELESLGDDELVPVYRNVQVFDDDSLGSPMAFSDEATGERRTLEGGKWNYSEPREVKLTPEQQKQLDELNKNGYLMVSGQKTNELPIGEGLKFVKPKTKPAQLQYFLKKSPEDSGLWAAYNPYDHAIETPLNTQFGEAYKRPNLVVVRSLMPKSELEGHYKADYAKDSTGAHKWNNGRTLYLSRYSKIDKVLTREEEAKLIDKYWKENAGKREALKTHRDYKRFVPAVRRELEKMGYRFEYDGKELTPEETRELDRQQQANEPAIPGEEGRIPDVTAEDIKRINAKMSGKWVGEPKETLAQSMVRRVKELAAKLGAKVRIVTSADELGESPTGRQRKMKGMYDTETGGITIVVGNHENLADVENTMLHEAVGHGGFRVLFDTKEKLAHAMDELYRVSGEKIRKWIDGKMRKLYDSEVDSIMARKRKEREARGEKPSEHHLEDMAAAHIEASSKKDEFRRIATEEYGANLAGRIGEKGFEKLSAEEQTFWGRLKSMLQKALQRLSEGLNITGKHEWTDKDWAYVLHEAYKREKNGGKPSIFDKADTIAMRMRTGFGEGERKQEERKNEDDNPDAGMMFRDGDDDDIGDVSLGDAVNKMRDAAVESNANNLHTKREAMKAIGGNLSKLRQAMSRQKVYDKGTVKSVTDMAREMLQNGMLDKLSSYEAKRILSAAANVTGAENTTRQINKLMDVMADNQLRNAADTFGKLLHSKGTRVNASGVEVQGKLDPDGAAIVDVLKKGVQLDKDELNERIAKVLDKIGSEDKAIADQAANELTGLQLAARYAEDIKGSKTEEAELRESLKEAKAQKDAGQMGAEAYKQYCEATEDAMRQNKIERADAYRQLIAQLGGVMGESAERAKAWREAEKQRVQDIQHNANSDMQGRPCNEHHKPSSLQKLCNSSIVRFFLQPLATFEQMMRMFGNKNVRGEGYLWNRFVRGWLRASENEYSGYRDALKELDDKVSEIFGKKMRWGDIFSLERKMPTMEVSFWDGGEMKHHTLTQGNLAYIYMVDKMSDGRMKLRAMGITDEAVEQITKALDPRLRKLADWMQDEFLVQRRNKYNEVHKRMFGASMAAIENYFPLKILSGARTENVDVADDTGEPTMTSTTTGSIIKRRRNNLALDITNADAFSVILEHLQDMEHWAAYSEFNRDLNTLLSYKRFKNQVMNMSSAYGAGETLWKNFRNVCQLAAGSYRPPVAPLDKAAVNFAKGVTAAKISFRVFTALKQLLSFPAYLPDASAKYLLQNLANPVSAWKWSMENLPLFHKRWNSRMAGDPRLLKTEMDWKAWRSRVVQIASKYGMSPNAFVDAVTVAMGANAIYKTRLAKYLKQGYEKERAEEKARQDAEIAYNQTQQSSEGAFLSTMQADRSWLSVLLTIFRNSAMSYTRQEYDALRNLARKITTKGYKEKSVEFMTKQMVRDGLDEDTALRNAKREYKRSTMREFVRVATFGYILQLAWNLGAYLPYLLLGDNDDEKKKMLDDAGLHALMGSVEGMTGGDVLSAAGQYGLTGNGDLSNLSKEMPLASDLNAIYEKFGYDKVAATNDVINLLVQAGVGVNPQSLTDAVVGVMDYCDNNPTDARECALLIARIFNTPQSQLDKIYFDEIDLDGSDASKLSPKQIAERYAKYKMRRNAPLTGWMYGEDGAKERAAKYEDAAYNKAKDRLSGLTDRSSGQNLTDWMDEYKQSEKTVSRINKLQFRDPDKFDEEMGRFEDTPAAERYHRISDYMQQIADLTKQWQSAKTPAERMEAANEMVAAKKDLAEDLKEIK